MDEQPRMVRPRCAARLSSASRSSPIGIRLPPWKTAARSRPSGPSRPQTKPPKRCGSRSGTARNRESTTQLMIGSALDQRAQRAGIAGSSAPAAGPESPSRRQTYPAGADPFGLRASAHPRTAQKLVPYCGARSVPKARSSCRSRPGVARLSQTGPRQRVDPEAAEIDRARAKGGRAPPRPAGRWTRTGPNQAHRTGRNAPRRPRGRPPPRPGIGGPTATPATSIGRNQMPSLIATACTRRGSVSSNGSGSSSGSSHVSIVANRSRPEQHLPDRGMRLRRDDLVVGDDALALGQSVLPALLSPIAEVAAGMDQVLPSGHAVPIARPVAQQHRPPLVIAAERARTGSAATAGATPAIEFWPVRPT